MKLYLITGTSRSQLKNMPANLTEEEALLWLGAYIQQHAANGSVSVTVTRREHGLNIIPEKATHFYRLESIDMSINPKAGK